MRKKAATQNPGWKCRCHQGSSRSQIKPREDMTWREGPFLYEVQPSKIKSLVLRLAPVTVPIPRNTPLTSPLQSNSKLNTMTKISNTPKQKYKYRLKQWGSFLKFGIQCSMTRDQ